MSTNNVIKITSAKSYAPTVLLLDDQDVALTIHTALLKKLSQKIKIMAFKDPRKALACLQKKHVDLIITDYIMEGMNGFEFMNAAKSAMHGVYSPFIVVTASQDKEVHVKLKKEGVFKIYNKPINILDLTNTCSMILKIEKPKLMMPF